MLRVDGSRRLTASTRQRPAITRAAGGPQPRPNGNCMRRCDWKRSNGGGGPFAPNPSLNPIVARHERRRAQPIKLSRHPRRHSRPGIDAATDQMNQTLASVQRSLTELQAEAAAAGQPLPEPAPRTGAPATARGKSDDHTDPARVSQPTDPPGWERIYEGSFLEATLVTQLTGDFPGPVLAVVSVPFYSADRQHILVPRGARILGTAQAVANKDQSRLAVSFHRLLFPDGRWVSLEFHGLNQVGEGALKDRVNRHYLSMFTAVGAIGVLSGLTLEGSNPYAGGGAGFRAGAGQGLGQSATQILQRFLNRLPTITIRAGHRLRVWFTSDVLVPRPQGD